MTSPSLRPRPVQRAITDFLPLVPAAAPRPIVQPGRTVVLSLFDSTGIGLRCWAQRGFECHAYDDSGDPAERQQVEAGVQLHAGPLGSAEALDALARAHGARVAFACASPPSRDLSVAGARHWAKKRAEDPLFQSRAVDVVRRVEALFQRLKCPYYIANPATSQLGKLLRPPTHTFHPHHFGAHLPPSDAHPLFPIAVPARDAYAQHTGLWTGGGLRVPVARPVAPEWKVTVTRRRGGVRIRRLSPILAWKARGARACAPRGFALALCRRLLGGGGGDGATLPAHPP